MEQHPDLLQMTLSDLEHGGWQIDYLNLSGAARLTTAIKNTEVEGSFIFSPEGGRIGLSLLAKTRYPFNDYSLRLFRQLRLSLRQRDVRLYCVDKCSFYITWTAKTRRVVKKNSVAALRAELETQLDGGHDFIISCLHVLKSCTRVANQKGVRESHKRSILNPGLLTLFVRESVSGRLLH